MSQNLEKKLKNMGKSGWKQKAARIGASVVLPIASFFGGARDVKGAILPADLNRDGIVNFQDITILANRWLEKDPNIIPVYECGCLNEPNAVYVLQNDVNAQGTCFEIKADEIKFKINNHKISGNVTGSGIIVNCDNSTIENGEIYSFADGVQVSGNNNTFSLINTHNNYHHGFDVSGNNNTLSLITVNENNRGLVVNGNNNNLFSITAIENNNAGISLFGNNNIVKDSYFNSYGTESPDIDSNSVSNTFLECIYLSEGKDSSLIRSWNYKALVKDALGTPIANAKVYAHNIAGDLEFMVTTGADGKIPKVWLTDYINEGGTKIYSSPYTITATKGNKSATHVYDPNGFNSEDNFILEE